MEPFKNQYNSKSLTLFAKEIGKVHPEFNQARFKKSILPKLSELEMKDRVRLIAETLNRELDTSYPKAIKILLMTAGEEKTSGFMLWPISQFVEDYGLDNLKISLNAMKKITTHFTAEFCIRPFLAQYDKEVFETLTVWREHKNHHIRRLVSEGTRPNLPWGIKVMPIHNNLARNIDLIAPLRLDSSEYVRKSVANHLNDISRLDEKLFFKTINSFKEQTPEVLKVIRHASRTLLKAGHPKALSLHGYTKPNKIMLEVKLLSRKVKEGEYLPINISIVNKKDAPQKLLIEYIVGFLKKNGEYSNKVFRLKDCNIGANENLEFFKKIPFKKVTTRVQYSGKHFLSIQINGKVFSENSFNLKV